MATTRKNYRLPDLTVKRMLKIIEVKNKQQKAFAEENGVNYKDWTETDLINVLVSKEYAILKKDGEIHD